MAYGGTKEPFLGRVCKAWSPFNSEENLVGIKEDTEEYNLSGSFEKVWQLEAIRVLEGRQSGKKEGICFCNF